MSTTPIESTPIYANPPIQEALCEIHFKVKEPFSRNCLEDVGKCLIAEYPQQQVVNEQAVKLEISPEGIKQDKEDKGFRLFCRSADGIRIVQVSGTFLVVNHLKPYPGWETGFRSSILARCEQVFVVTQPQPIERVSLRYIDCIEIPENPIVWEKWFEPALPFPAIKETQLTGFQLQLSHSLAPNMHVVTNIVAMPAKKDQRRTPIILDLCVQWQSTPFAVGDLPDILESIHTPQGKVFEGYLTDETRRLFNKRD